ncbi:hypothetical protein AAE478_003990 [Parahypoxylon ruwenzoriense]
MIYFIVARIRITASIVNLLLTHDYSHNHVQDSDPLFASRALRQSPVMTTSVVAEGHTLRIPEIPEGFGPYCSEFRVVYACGHPVNQRRSCHLREKDIIIKPQRALLDEALRCSTSDSCYSG